MIVCMLSASSSLSRSLPVHPQPVVEVVDEMMVPILAAKTEAQRLDMAAEMWRYARDIYLQLAGQEHPDWSADEVQREAARRLAANFSDD